MARLFGPNGWGPDDMRLVPAVVFYDKSSIMNEPEFFQIKFERMKKISYFVIQDSTSHGSGYSQDFYIAYNDSEWKVYGGSNAKLSEITYSSLT